MQTRSVLGLATRCCKLPLSVVLVLGCSAQPPAGPADGEMPDPPELGIPGVRNPGPQLVSEEETLDLELQLTGSGGPGVRLFVSGLPEGARFDPVTRRLRFTPDFTQGGRSWTVWVIAIDSRASSGLSFPVSVRDTIRPPEPQVTRSETVGAWHRMTVSQKTDSYLDSPGHAGRTLTAVVTTPYVTDGPPRLPLRVGLHGFFGSPAREGWEGEIRVFPHDPMNSYWWGYSERLPGGDPSSGAVPPYTLRRVLHLVAWALRTFPIADPERVYVEGASMGGAGAMLLGLGSARHFCWVESSLGQAIARNHRPSRLAQLGGLWGTPERNLPGGLPGPAGAGVWDAQDLTRLLLMSPESRDQFLFLKHGKDDGTIHFGAAVIKSPLTERSLYGVLQEQHLGHTAVWDEGGHGPEDPVLRGRWWESGWNPVFDDTAYLRRNLAFPAFSRCSTDRSPGTGRGNGRVSWNAESGYAGNLAVAGDTGWDGEVAGVLNRGLRWDARAIVDTEVGFAIPLKVLDGQGGPPPRPGYPTLGDRLDGSLPVKVDVTPRRVQRFRCLPGEPIRWRFGAQQGVVSAGEDGSVTAPALELTTQWQTLSLSRAPMQ
jgi:hypothetical protein